MPGYPINIGTGARAINPLAQAICWGFAVVNILLAFGMFFFVKPTVPIAVANILSYQAWGLVFLALGAAMAYTLVQRRWWTLRRVELACVLVKAIWLVALLLRCLETPSTVLITVVWGFLAYIQAVLYVFFFPTPASGGGRDV